MDILVLATCFIVSGVVMAYSFRGGRAGWAMLGFFAAIISAVATLALFNDGSLTLIGCPTAASCSEFPLASANGNFVSDFNGISVAFSAFPLVELIVTIRRTFKI